MPNDRNDRIRSFPKRALNLRELLSAFVFLTVCLTNANINAADRVQISKNLGHQDISGKLEFIVAERDYEITELVNGNFELSWQAANKFLPDFGYQENALWFRTRIYNFDHPENDWILYNFFSSTDFIDVYFVEKDNIIDAQKGGDGYPFHERSVSYFKPSFSFNLPPESELDIYIRVKNEGKLKFQLFLINEAKYFINAAQSKMLDGFFYGGMIAIIFFNLFLLIISREKNYFYFVFFTGSITLLMAEASGYAFQYLWPSEPLINKRADLVLIALCYLSGTLFAADYLNTKILKPLTRNLVSALVLLPVFFILCAFVLPYATMKDASWILGLFLGVVATLVITEILFTKDMPPQSVRAAKYFLVAWGIFFAAIPLYFLDPKIGMLVLITFLSVLFADKINRTRVEKIEAEARSLKLAEDNKVLEKQSTVDKLTQLKNKKYLVDSLDIEYGSARRQKEAISLFLVNVDNFRNLNENFGSEAADAYLVETADLLLKIVKRPRDLVCRYENDSFAVLLPSTNLEGAKIIAERIRESVEGRRVYVEEHSLSATASIGIVSHESDNFSDEKTLITQCELALSYAKENGRNQIQIFI